MKRIIALWCLLPLTGWTHELRPGYLDISGLGNGRAEVTWKLPVVGTVREAPEVVFDAETRTTTPPTEQVSGDSRILRWEIERRGGLDGAVVRIEAPDGRFPDALASIRRLDGRHTTYRVTPEQPSFTIESAPGWGRLAATYLMLGIEHILLGFDHLLFVLGLLLIVDGTRMLVKTITAFTLAHSLSLAIATFRIVEVPEGPLNACIALSILFLGPEIVRKWRGGDSFTLRHPWVVAFAFGLLHGIGFASGLSVTGLPHASIPLALLWFNLGVEAGQLLFVFIVLAMQRAWKSIDLRWPLVLRRAPGYAIGILGAFWTIDRLAATFTI